MRTLVYLGKSLWSLQSLNFENNNRFHVKMYFFHILTKLFDFHTHIFLVLRETNVCDKIQLILRIIDLFRSILVKHQQQPIRHICNHFWFAIPLNLLWLHVAETKKMIGKHFKRSVFTKFCDRWLFTVSFKLKRFI